jgi:hypothetical protein
MTQLFNLVPLSTVLASSKSNFGKQVRLKHSGMTDVYAVPSIKITDKRGTIFFKKLNPQIQCCKGSTT